jgi:hypothetical protein
MQKESVVTNFKMPLQHLLGGTKSRETSVMTADMWTKTSQIRNQIGFYFFFLKVALHRIRQKRICDLTHSFTPSARLVCRLESAKGIHGSVKTLGWRKPVSGLAAFLLNLRQLCDNVLFSLSPARVQGKTYLKDTAHSNLTDIKLFCQLRYVHKATQNRTNFSPIVCPLFRNRSHRHYYKIMINLPIQATIAYFAHK